MLTLIGVFFAALDGGRGTSSGAGTGFLVLGIVVFLIVILYGIIKKTNRSENDFFS
ncbi:MAG: hypothetical protein ACI4O5_08330 [Oscillospiraceae bacterium]